MRKVSRDYNWRGLRQGQSCGARGSAEARSKTASMKLLVLASPDSEELAQLQRLPEGAEVMHTSQSAESVLEKVSEPELCRIDAVLAAGVGLKACGADTVSRLWYKLPNLKWVHSASAGVNHLLFDELVQSDCVVTNARGVFSNSLSEYVIMAAKWFAVNGFKLLENQRAHSWSPFIVEELRDTTMAVVGFGDIGRACAEKAKAFKMNVIATRRNPERCKNDPLCDEVYHTSQLPEMLSKADYVLNSLPLAPGTERLISLEAIKRMKPTAVFLSVGRGSCVDQEALTHALEVGAIRGAALDVFKEEPLPQKDKLWQLSNVLISPHNADRTQTFQEESLDLFVRNVRKYLEGGTGKLENVVDKNRGY